MKADRHGIPSTTVLQHEKEIQKYKNTKIQKIQKGKNTSLQFLGAAHNSKNHPALPKSNF